MAVFCQYGSTSLNSYTSSPAINVTDESRRRRHGNNHHSNSSNAGDDACFLLGISPTLYSPFATSPRAMTSQSHAIASLYVTTTATSPNHHHRSLKLQQQQQKTPAPASSVVRSKNAPRPCLKSKIGGGSCSLEAHREQERRRRVTFADSKGFTLTRVKYVFENTSEPPQSFIDGDSLYEAMKNLNLAGCRGFDDDVTAPRRRSSAVTQAPPPNKFHLEFDQPFADYAGFRAKLERDFVALENCSVERSGVLSGTIKVRNLDFDKQVHVRVTTDQWATYVDRACTHNAAASNGDPLHDTFEFNINDLARELDSSAAVLSSAHFCVRFSCAGCEYWDNNGGRNYTINVTGGGGQSSMQQRHQPAAELKPAYRSLQNTPTTYIELPSPQHSSWASVDCTSPFY